MNLDLGKKLKQINDGDLKTMYGTTVVSLIEKQEDAEEKLNVYLEYEPPVHIGDIIEFQGKTYCVTCVYTDNSVDICGEDATKQNIGLYMKLVKKVGRLQVIVEE